jgi:hypothetical protein
MSTSGTPELALRSYTGVWDRTRWEDLPADGNTYEIIDGGLDNPADSDARRRVLSRSSCIMSTAA